MGQGPGADGEGRLVDVEVGGMQRVSRAVERRHAQPEQAAGYVLQVAGEVLAAHAGQADLLDVRLADDLARGPDADRRDLGVVDHGPGPLLEGDVDRGPAGGGEPAGDLGDALLDQRGRAIAEGADRPHQLDLVRNHVALAPPRMQPNVSTQGSRELTDRGTSW